jgi:tetratricopeptide (TPR) repeat protein
LPIESHEPGFAPSRPSRARRESPSARPRGPVRSPSASGFMTAAAAASAALFFVLWWMLQGEESPWVPAGLAASVVMLVAASARIVVMRRRTRYVQEQGLRDGRDHAVRRPSGKVMQSTSLHSAALRALQKQSSDADARELPPQRHREIFDLCTEYLSGVEQALLSPGLPAEGRLSLRAGQARARTLQKHHLLTWARGSARALTHEAQQRARLYEKVETANRALECIDSALKFYPDEEELKISAQAVREFITSSRVAHWVELAERAAFKGYYRRAIDRYQDALFYLTRDGSDQDREAGAERITREIDLLRARLTIERATIDSYSTKASRQKP